MYISIIGCCKMKFVYSARTDIAVMLLTVVIFITMTTSVQNDWQLRGSFFDYIVGVAAYVGWQSSIILKPLLQQVGTYVYKSVYMFSDSFEIVIVFFFTVSCAVFVLFSYITIQ